MMQDAQGLAITVASASAAAAFDQPVAGYLDYRADVAQHTEAALTADHGFGLAHCLIATASTALVRHRALRMRNAATLPKPKQPGVRLSRPIPTISGRCTASRT